MCIFKATSFFFLFWFSFSFSISCIFLLPVTILAVVPVKMCPVLFLLRMAHKLCMR